MNIYNDKKQLNLIFRFLIENPGDIAKAEELCKRPEFCITVYVDPENIKVKY